ncbi:MAG: GxxExxY protein [Planctomycetota bacterium]
MYERHDNRRGGNRGRGRGRHGGGHGRHGGHGGDERRGTPLSDLDPALTEMSRTVIGCAIEVHKTLGPGFEREVYRKALHHEMTKQGLDFKPDHQFTLTYDSQDVGTTTATLYIGDRFLVEILARVGEVGTAERIGLRAQLRAADTELGLIINFGERRLKDGLVRVLNPDKLNELRDDEEDEEDDDEYEDDDEEYEDDDEEEDDEEDDD